MRVDRVDRQFSQSPLSQQRNEAAFHNFRSERKTRTKHYAMASKGKSMNKSRIRRCERPGNAHGLSVPIRPLETPIPPSAYLG